MDITVELPDKLVSALKEHALEMPYSTDPEVLMKWWLIVIREVLSQTGTSIFHTEKDQRFLLIVFRDEIATMNEKVDAICLYLIDSVQFTKDVVCKWDEKLTTKVRDSLSQNGFLLWCEAMTLILYT